MKEGNEKEALGFFQEIRFFTVEQFKTRKEGLSWHWADLF